jgi:hypothetical protein
MEMQRNSISNSNSNSIPIHDRFERFVIHVHRNQFILPIAPLPLLGLSGRTCHGTDDDSAHGVRERGTHHGEVICGKQCQPGL